MPVRTIGSRSMLRATHPELAREFETCVCNGRRCGRHTPENTSKGSHRRFRWRCPKGHLYVAKVGSRASGTRTTGCAKCSGASRPGTLSPLRRTHRDLYRIAVECRTCGNCDRDTVTAGSNCEWLFRCEEGHEFVNTMYNAARRVGPCRVCTHATLTDSDVADEFVRCLCGCGEREHDVDNLTVGSGRTVRWQCRSCAQQWDARIADRLDPVTPTGCPTCAPKNHSRREIDVMTSLARRLGTDYSGPIRVKGWSYPVDFADRRRRLVVQYDAGYWHKDRVSSDRRCVRNLRAAGWTVVRIREKPLKPVGGITVATTPHEPSELLATKVVARLHGRRT